MISVNFETMVVVRKAGLWRLYSLLSKQHHKDTPQPMQCSGSESRNSRASRIRIRNNLYRSGSGSSYQQAKKNNENLDFHTFGTSSLKTGVNVTSNRPKTRGKKFIFCWHLGNPTEKKSRVRDPLVRIHRSGSVKMSRIRNTCSMHGKKEISTVVLLPENLRTCFEPSV